MFVRLMRLDAQGNADGFFYEEELPNRYVDADNTITLPNLLGVVSHRISTDLYGSIGDRFQLELASESIPVCKARYVV